LVSAELHQQFIDDHASIDPQIGQRNSGILFHRFHHFSCLISGGLQHGARQEIGHEGTPDTLPAAVRAHMNAVLDTVPIAGPRPKLTEGAEPGDARCVPYHDHGESLCHFGIEPGFAAGLGELLLRIDRRRIANDFVVDRQDLRKIAAGRAVDHGPLVTHDCRLRRGSSRTIGAGRPCCLLWGRSTIPTIG